jgi:Tfp pilus assembly protein PilO
MLAALHGSSDVDLIKNGESWKLLSRMLVMVMVVVVVVMVIVVISGDGGHA